VQAKAVGTATITATSTSDPTKTATATITVDPGKPDIPAPKVELALTGPGNTSVIQFFGDITQVAGPVSGVQALKFPKEAYAFINHGIAANGVDVAVSPAVSTRVNVYTLLIDFQVPALDGYNCFYSVSDKSATFDRTSILNGDGTVFLRAASPDDVVNGYELGWGIVGLGSAGGYSNLVCDYAKANSSCPVLAPGVTDHKGTDGTVKINTWHRLVLTYDLGVRCFDGAGVGGAGAAIGVKRYLDGVQIHAGGYDFNSRLAMRPEGVLLHSDEANGEGVVNGDCAEMSIANVAIWDVQLTDGQVKALGKAGEPMKW
jgi:hypothetical protein